MHPSMEANHSLTSTSPRLSCLIVPTTVTCGLTASDIVGRTSWAVARQDTGPTCRSVNSHDKDSAGPPITQKRAT